MQIDGNVIISCGDKFIETSLVFGVVLFCYFLILKRRYALRLIFDDTEAFAKNLVPHIVYFVICWKMTVVLQKFIGSHRPIADIVATNYLMSKTVFTVVIVTTKHYLYRVQSYRYKIPLFVGLLITAAVNESSYQDKYPAEAVNTTMLLMFWLTVLILVSRNNVKHNSSVLGFILILFLYIFLLGFMILRERSPPSFPQCRIYH